MASKRFVSKNNYQNKNIPNGKVAWRSPSNIALIKYWGKYGEQLPRNPSISFTLSEAYTDTLISYESLDFESDRVSVSFYFEGKPHEAFQMRIETLLNKMIPFFPFLTRLHLVIESENSFPHSSGIASSASSMSALALCLCSIEEQIDETQNSDFFQKASFIARLGSGSASRSVYPSLAIWGEAASVAHSSNLYAVQAQGIHEVFLNYHDDILIVSEDQKSVSSTEGHRLMDHHDFRDQRYEQANRRFDDIIHILKSGDVWKFGTLIENEALTLHGLMMCSEPSYILLEPNTVEIIKRIRSYRVSNNIPVFFTLDAGPNIHLLYPHEHFEDVQSFLEKEVIELCSDKRIIRDKVGTGPQKLASLGQLL